MNIFDSLKPDFKGDIDSVETTLETYSHDASLFEIKPKVVVYPKDTEDIKTLVKWVNAHKQEDPTLSLTPRAAGTDMTGGSIGSSIIVDFIRYCLRTRTFQFLSSETSSKVLVGSH